LSKCFHLNIFRSACSLGAGGSSVPAKREKGVENDQGPVDVDTEHGIDVIIVLNVSISLVFKEIVVDVVGNEHFEYDSPEHPYHRVVLTVPGVQVEWHH